MSADFTVIILAVLGAAGVTVLFDRFVLRPRRLAAQNAREPWLVELARSAFPVLLIVMLFRSFVFEPFRIPSASMLPGLMDGDFILVSKFAYGLRLPLINMKLLPTWQPQRGDVIVFRSTSGPPITLIKRLVGLPGDHVVVRDNRLLINGQPVPQSPGGRFAGGSGFSGAELERETFGQADHLIMLAPRMRAADFDAVVPAGRYFFMGDNRNDSEDSRFTQVGFVPEEHLVGHAIRIWMSWPLPGWPRLGRIGMPIR